LGALLHEQGKHFSMEAGSVDVDEDDLDLNLAKRFCKTV